MDDYCTACEHYECPDYPGNPLETVPYSAGTGNVILGWPERIKEWDREAKDEVMNESAGSGVGREEGGGEAGATTGPSEGGRGVGVGVSHGKNMRKPEQACQECRTREQKQ